MSIVHSRKQVRTLGPDLAFAKITFPGRGSPTSNPRLGNRGLHKEPGFVERCLRVVLAKFGVDTEENEPCKVCSFG